MKRSITGSVSLFFMLALISLLYFSCSKSDSNSLAPYEGATDLSNITIEPGSFRPKITWLGGYVSVLGVNRGKKAALDTSLVWLIYAPSNGIHFPVTFGTLPPGAQDLTASYGGKTTDSLSEDNLYTYWIVKEDAWSQISATAKGKSFLVDSTISNSIKLTGDTVKVSPMSLSRNSQNIDVFINIRDVSTFGKLGEVSITAPSKNPYATVSWKITQAGVQDSNISAIGITEGTQYNPNVNFWEVYSLDLVGGTEVYGKTDRIKPPVAIGQKIDSTKVFVEFPATGLLRGKDYYLWIANKNWDQANRFRGTSFYAYATFHVY